MLSIMSLHQSLQCMLLHFILYLACILVFNPGGIINRCAAFTDFQEAGLKAHNEFRAKHQAPELVLDDELNQKADQCAKYYLQKGVIDHTCPFKKPTGTMSENLHRGSLEKVSDPPNGVKGGVESWYRELPNYDFCKETEKDPKKAAGHFTQLIWKATSKLGLGYAADTTKKIFFVVGLYSPPGNFEGKYKENVIPAEGGGCSEASGMWKWKEVTLLAMACGLLSYCINSWH